MSRTQGHHSPYSRPAPQGGHAHGPATPRPTPCCRTTPATPRPACPPTTSAGVPAGQWPTRWEVVLRLRASAVLPGWSSGKV